ncbi:olfactory receptor 14I1-like [Emydura macquarii macquarii]|uniref:olfactory receptor 14I1-like n=1 Tax=Emydura macquarii macquarii TaxID=1129001 RepID=UPI00352A7E43
MAYLAALVGNLLVITAVALDPHLHTPMYFFLMNLSIIDLGSISVTVPKSMANSFMNTRSISYSGCVTQVSLFVFLISADLALLTVMAYDPYVAICRPLHYERVMNRGACVQMAIFKTVLRIPSEQGRHKAFSTCLPHLIVVTMFLSISSFAHLKPTSSSTSGLDLLEAVLYSMVSPVTNHIIYSMRNKEIKNAVEKMIGWRLFTKKKRTVFFL